MFSGESTLTSSFQPHDLSQVPVIQPHIRKSGQAPYDAGDLIFRGESEIHRAFQGINEPKVVPSSKPVADERSLMENRSEDRTFVSEMQERFILPVNYKVSCLVSLFSCSRIISLKLS